MKRSWLLPGATGVRVYRRPSGLAPLPLFPRGGVALPSIGFSSLTVSEGATTGTLVAVLSVSGGTGPWTYTKTADPSGKFALSSGGALTLTAALDYETATSHSVSVQATNGVTTITRTFTINVLNVIEGTLGPSTASFTVGAAAGTVITAISGLDLGADEIVATLNPNDGRLALDANRRTLLVGLSAAAAGTIAATLTTSAGRTLNMGVTVAPVASDTTPDAFAFTNIAGATSLSFVEFQPNSALTGYDTPIPVSFAGGLQFSIDNKASYAASGTIPVGVGSNLWFKKNTGAAGTNANTAVTLGGVSATINIATQAAASASTPLTIAPADVIAWFDNTDPSTMYQDTLMTTPIVPGGTLSQRTVAAQKAKTVANPNGDSNFVRTQANPAYRPVFSATAYNNATGGGYPGITYNGAQFFSTRDKTLGGDLTSVMIAAQITAAGWLIGVGQRDVRLGVAMSAAEAAGFLARDQGTATESSVAFGGNNGVYTPGPDSPRGAPQNYEFATDSGVLRVYRSGTLVASSSGTAMASYASPMDIAYWFDGGYNNDGTTPTRPTTSNAAGIEQHVLILSAPLNGSANGAVKRTAMQAYFFSTSGGSTYTIPIDTTAPTTMSAPASADANSITVANASGFNGKTIIIPASTGMGTIGPGGHQHTGPTFANESAVLAATSSTLGVDARATDFNKIYKARQDLVTATASASGTTLTVTAIQSGNGFLGGQLRLGDKNGTAIATVVSGPASGPGTYTLSTPVSVAAQTVYIVGGGGYYPWDATDYYKNRTRPKSLVVQVTASGNTLTFQGGVTLQAAVPSGTAIKVDQGAWLKSQLIGPDGATFNITGATGDYALAPDALLFTGKKDWTIAGPTSTTPNFVAPPGLDGALAKFLSSQSPTIRDLKLTANHVWNVGNTIAPGMTTGVEFENCSDAAIVNTTVIDPTLAGILFRYSTRGSRTMVGSTPFKLEDGTTPIAYFAQNSTVRRNQAAQGYLAQWAFNVIDTGGESAAVIGEFRDITYDGVFLGAALETFRSRGAVFTRPLLKNGIMASNSSGDVKIDRLVMLISENSRDISVASPMNNITLLNVNANIQGTSGSGATGGGQIINPTITMPGWLDSTGWVPKAIAIDTTGWSVTGNFNPTVKDDGNRLGLITVPAPKAGGNYSVDAVGPAYGPRIVFPDYTTISGVRLRQLDPVAYPGQDAVPSNYAISSQGANTPNVTISNTISGASSPSIGAPGATLTGNTSNQAYGAL